VQIACRVTEEFDFEATDINETLIRDLASGDFLDHQRNLVLIHCPAGHFAEMSREGAAPEPARPISPSVLHAPASETVVAGGSSMSSMARQAHGKAMLPGGDLVNKLDAEARAERQGRTAELISRLDFLIPDELGYLPFAQTGGQPGRWGNAPLGPFLILLHPSHQQALRTRIHHRHHQPGIRRMADRLR